LEVEAMKLCPHCSASLEDDTVRCTKCGKWILEKRDVVKGKKKSGNRARLLVLGGLAVGAWALWITPETTWSPRDLLDPEPSRAKVFSMMRSDLERLWQQEEEYFRIRGEYSGKPEDLGFSPSEGVTVAIIAMPTGWSGATTYRDYPRDVGCAVYVGSANPPHTPLRPQTRGTIDCTTQDF